MKDLVIIGASGFAKEVLWLADTYNISHNCWNILGFVDDSCINSDYLFATTGYKVIGNDNWLMKRTIDTDVIFGIGDCNLRKSLYEQYKNNLYLKFPTLISDEAIVSNRIRYGIGCIICNGVSMTVDIVLGNFVTVNLNCTIGHDTEIENFVQINPGTNVSGNVHIGNICDIGTGVQIIQGLTVGDNTIIGAGTVVIRNIRGDCTVVGNPSRMLDKE